MLQKKISTGNTHREPQQVLKTRHADIDQLVCRSQTIRSRPTRLEREEHRNLRLEHWYGIPDDPRGNYPPIRSFCSSLATSGNDYKTLTSPSDVRKTRKLVWKPMSPSTSSITKLEDSFSRCSQLSSRHGNVTSYSRVKETIKVRGDAARNQNGFHDNQLVLLYDCGCHGCAAYVKLVEDRRRRGDQVSRLERGCFRVVPTVERSIPHKDPPKDKFTQTSVSCNSSWIEIFFNCFRCGRSNDTESLSSAGSDSDADGDGDGSGESDELEEHEGEVSVDEDSGGGDDAASDDGSLNSAEAIEGDGNQLENRNGTTEADGDDGDGGSCCSDGSDSLTELRARFAFSRRHLLARKSNYSSRLQTVRGGRSTRTCRGFGVDDDDDVDESATDDLEESAEVDEDDSLAEFAMLDDDG